jgi:fused signal recognition particle receptor
MFSFFKKKQPPQGTSSESSAAESSGHTSAGHDDSGQVSSPQADGVQNPQTESVNSAAAAQVVTPLSEVATPLPEAPVSLAETAEPVTNQDDTSEPPVSLPESAVVEPAETEVSAESEPKAGAEPTKRSWMARLRQGLARTGQNLGGLFVGVKVDESLFEELESALIMADAGVEATEILLTALRARVRKDRLADAAQVKTALRDILTEHLRPLEKPFPSLPSRPQVDR